MQEPLGATPLSSSSLPRIQTIVRRGHGSPWRRPPERHPPSVRCSRRGRCAAPAPGRRRRVPSAPDGRRSSPRRRTPPPTRGRAARKNAGDVSALPWARRDEYVDRCVLRQPPHHAQLLLGSHVAGQEDAEAVHLHEEDERGRIAVADLSVVERPEGASRDASGRRSADSSSPAITGGSDRGEGARPRCLLRVSEGTGVDDHGFLHRLEGRRQCCDVVRIEVRQSDREPGDARALHAGGSSAGSSPVSTSSAWFRGASRLRMSAALPCPTSHTTTDQGPCPSPSRPAPRDLPGGRRRQQAHPRSEPDVAPGARRPVPPPLPLPRRCPRAPQASRARHRAAPRTRGRPP